MRVFNLRREFRCFLNRRDRDGVEASMLAFDRQDCWHEAIHQFTVDPTVDHDLGEAPWML
jgi:hypothetical protein